LQNGIDWRKADLNDEKLSDSFLTIFGDQGTFAKQRTARFDLAGFRPKPDRRLV
jgi:hypothetical protein